MFCDEEAMSQACKDFFNPSATVQFLDVVDACGASARSQVKVGPNARFDFRHSGVKRSAVLPLASLVRLKFRSSTGL
jgi:hypothetical protein